MAELPAPDTAIPDAAPDTGAGDKAGRKSFWSKPFGRVAFWVCASASIRTRRRARQCWPGRRWNLFLTLC